MYVVRVAVAVDGLGDADEPPASRTSHSIIYTDELQLRAFLKSSGKKEFFHPAIEVRESAIAGRGLFATERIREGELISYENPDDYLVLNMAQVESRTQEEQDFWWHFCYQIGDDAWFGPKSPEVVSRKRTFFTNHSCDPSTWFIDEITMTARRDILPGEEITYDYSTSESYIDPEMETVVCRCNSPICRERMHPTDWQRPELWERYGTKWQPYLCAKITAYRAALIPVYAGPVTAPMAISDSASASAEDDSETASTGSSSSGEDENCKFSRLSSSCGRSHSLADLQLIESGRFHESGAYDI